MPYIECRINSRRNNMFKHISLLWKGRQVAREAFRQKEAVQEAYLKHSWKSVEFWVAALAGVGALTAGCIGVVPASAASAIMLASSAAYSLSRGMAKFHDAYGGVKPSWGSTETWVSLLGAIGQALLASAAGLPPDIAAQMATASGVALQISRGLAKGGVQPPNL
jgi:hypothetical protein